MAEEEEWVKLQKKTFTKWANSHLRKHRTCKDIGDLYEDLKDGTRLIALLETLSLTPFPFKYNKTPRMEIHRQENLKNVFVFLRDVAKIPMLNIGAEDVGKGNRKIMLALFWAFIQFYQLNAIATDGVSGKDGLMIWAKRQTAGYEDVDVKNFHTSWASGKAFAALLDRHAPEQIGYDTLSQGDREAMLVRAFAVADEVYNVSQLISPEDIINAPNGKPDEKIVVTYLSLLYNELARFHKESNAARSITVAVGITMKHEKLMRNYESGSLAAAEWIAVAKAKYSNLKDHGDSSEVIGGKIQDFLKHRRVEKPPKKAEIDALVGSYTTLNQSCKNNGRPVHLPKKAWPPAKLEEAWRGLEAVEVLYEDSVTSSFALFRRAEALLSKVEVKIAKAGAFLDDAPKLLNSVDYGGTSTQARALFETAKTTSEQLNTAAETPAEVKTVLNDVVAMGVTHAKHAGILASAEKLALRCPKLKEAAASRVRRLELTLNEYAKRDRADDIKSWIDDQIRVITGRDAGVPRNKLSQVEHLELLINREFVDGCRMYKPQLEAIEANKQITPRRSFSLSMTSVRSSRGSFSATVATPKEDTAALVVVDLKNYLKTVAALWKTMEAAAATHRVHLTKRQAELHELLATKDKYNVTAGDLVSRARQLSVFLQQPVFVDSEADCNKAIKFYKEKVESPKSPDSLFSLRKQFEGPLTALATKLEAALARGEEACSGAFHRFAMEQVQARLTELDAFSNLYDAKTQALLKEEQEKERLRKEFAASCVAVRKEIVSSRVVWKFKDWACRERELVEELHNKLVSLGAEKEASAARLEVIATALSVRGVLANQHTTDSVTTVCLAWETLEKETGVASKAAETLVLEVQRIENLRVDYRANAKALKGRVDAIILDYKKKIAESFLVDQGATAAEVKAILEEFHSQYKNTTKISLQGALSTSNSDLSAIHEAQLKIFNPAWSVKDGTLDGELSKEGLAATFALLETTEAQYELGLRGFHLRMQQMELDLLTMESKCDQMQEWLIEWRATLASHTYGENLATTQALSSNAVLDSAVAESNAAQMREMKTRLDAGSYDPHARKAELDTVLGRTQKEHDEAKETGPRYYESLEVTKQEYVKLATLVDPAAWIASLSKDFDDRPWPPTSGGKPTLTETTLAKKAFEVSYTNQLPTAERAINEVHESSLSSQASYGGRGSLVTVGPEIQRLMGEISALNLKAADRKAALQKDLDAHRAVADKSRLFAKTAAELVDELCANIEEELGTQPTSGGLGLAAVTSDVEAYDSKVLLLGSALDEKHAECLALAEFLTSSGYSEAQQAFQRFTMAAVTAKAESTKAFVGRREQELKGPDGLLEKEKHFEELRLEFARVAAAFRASVEAASTKLQATPTSTDLKKQLEYINLVKSDFETTASLQGAEEAAAQLEAHQVMMNPNSNDNIFTLRAASAAFYDNFKQLSASLAQQIAVEQGRQISPETLREIQEIFADFDTDDSNELGIAEFHSGLTGIGVAMTKEKVDACFLEIKNPETDTVSFDAFLPFMEECLTKPGSSPEDVAQAFKDIKSFDISAVDHISPEQLREVITDKEVLAYLEDKMTKGTERDNRGQYNFAQFTKEIFKK